MNKISLIINTASMDPLVRTNHNMYRGRPYGERAKLLKEKILPQVVGKFDEVIVAGTFEEGEGYTYIEVEPRYRDRRDALYQREYGARHAIGDILVFCHDDHVPEEHFTDHLRIFLKEWDLLIPERRHSVTNEILNNGKADGYMGGHCLVMRRWLWAEVSWLSVDTEWWDVSLTRLWKNAGGRLVWTEDLIHYDLEADETET